MKILLLETAPPDLVRALQTAVGVEVVCVASEQQGQQLLSRERFALVDAMLARERSLEDEIQVRVERFFERLKGHSAAGVYDLVMREVERPLIAAALRRARGVQSAAARALGIDRGTLARRIRALGLGATEAER